VNRLRSCIALLLFLTGCVPLSSNGTRHYVIIGFGIVSVPLTNSPAAQVVKSQAIGLSINDQPGTKLSIGYMDSTVINVQTNTNILIEVSKLPGQPLKVTTP
jgi:hypothetical protein